MLCMANGSSLQGDEGERLSLNALNQNVSGANIIHVNGGATIRIRKNSIFDIKTDSRSENLSLLYFA